MLPDISHAALKGITDLSNKLFAPIVANNLLFVFVMNLFVVRGSRSYLLFVFVVCTQINPSSGGGEKDPPHTPPRSQSVPAAPWRRWGAVFWTQNAV